MDGMNDDDILDTPRDRGHTMQGLYEGRAWLQDGMLHVERGLPGDCADDPSADYSLWSFTKADVQAIFALGTKLLGDDTQEVP